MTQDTKYPQPSLINPFELFKMNPSFGLKNTHKKSKEPKQLSFTFLFLLCSQQPIDRKLETARHGQ